MNLTHKKTGEVVQGNQYIKGQHPPPAGVQVTMGLHGVLARHVSGATLVDGDWLLPLPAGVAIHTDMYIRKHYRLEGETVADDDKPVKLG